NSNLGGAHFPRLVNSRFVCYIVTDFGRVENRFRPAQAGRGRKVRTPEGAMPRNPRSLGCGRIHAGEMFRVSAAETNDSLPRWYRGRQNSAYSPSKIIFPQAGGGSPLPCPVRGAF